MLEFFFFQTLGDDSALGRTPKDVGILKSILRDMAKWFFPLTLGRLWLGNDDTTRKDTMGWHEHRETQCGMP